MAALATMMMGDLNEDRKPVYSLFQKPSKPQESPNDPNDVRIPSIPLASMPANIPVKNSKAEEKSRKPTGSKSEGEPLYSFEYPYSSEQPGRPGQDVMDVDPSEERRKRRKTISPARETSNVPTGESAMQPRRSGRDSAAVFYGFVPPVEDHTGMEHARQKADSPALVQRKVGRPKKKPEVIVIDDELEFGPEYGVSADVLGIPRSSTPPSKSTDTQAQGRPKKVLKLNPKTGTIGSPPTKKTVVVKEKSTKLKKTGSKIVIIHYGSDSPLPASIGQRIDQILDGSTTIPIRSKPSKPEKPVKVAAKPLKNLHPLFGGKGAIKPKQEVIHKPASKKAVIIDLTGPVFPKEKSIVRPDASNFVGFGAPAKILKFPGAVEPAWPWRGMVHVRGHDELENVHIPVDESQIVSRPRKSKSKSTQIPHQEHLLWSIADNLQIKEVLRMVQEVNLNDYPPLPPCLRIPEKHLESGKKIQRRVRKELLAPLAANHDSEDSSEDDLRDARSTRDTIHPALKKHHDAIPSSMSAYDNATFEAHAWTHKYSPQTAAEVLQTGREAFILKDWLQNLTVNAVEGSLGSSKGKPETPELTGKRKRKGKKLDGFIISDGEESDLDELSEPDEDDSLQGIFSARKTVVRAANGKDAGKLKNSVLVSGPHGCGKTAAVYAVAKELNFEVFEINSSSRRSGKDILEKVGDMTRNHQVQRQNLNAIQPLNDDQRIEQALAEDIQSGRQGTMNSFFKPKAVVEPKAKLPKLPPPAENEQPKDTPVVKAPPKDQKQSLILIEEVDILYEEDKNFWQTIMNLIITSKRPIIMTCNDESFVPELNSALHAILRFSPAPVDLAADHMLLVAASEGHILRREAIKTLYESRNFDLRASISEMNFWCQFGVGDQKHGGDWYYRRYPGKDLDAHGNKIRVVSENTYHTGMGCVSGDFLASGMDSLSLEEEVLHELWDGWSLDAGDWHTHSPINDWASSFAPSKELSALEAYNEFAEYMSVSDICSAPTFQSENQVELDTSLPLPTEKTLEDNILGRKFIQASTVEDYQTLSKDMSIYFRSQARHLLHSCHESAKLSPINEEDVINLITTPSTTKFLKRQDLSLAFDPISYAPCLPTTTSTTLEPSVFDRTITIITLDVAPYVRGIVAYDQRLAKDRLGLSNLLSEGGTASGGGARKRMRTTRAAISALEGGVRSSTRRERYFGNALNGVFVSRTGCGSWVEALDQMVVQQE